MNDCAVSAITALVLLWILCMFSKTSRDTIMGSYTQRRLESVIRRLVSESDSLRKLSLQDRDPVLALMHNVASTYTLAAAAYKRGDHDAISDRFRREKRAVARRTKQISSSLSGTMKSR